ncbi:hypothetical protein PF011_g26989, partial [Phytophthora fragariae]
FGRAIFALHRPFRTQSVLARLVATKIAFVRRGAVDPIPTRRYLPSVMLDPILTVGIELPAPPCSVRHQL